ncbi:MAG: hypothetical protein AVDCRST_MAG66-1094 [uncultured Pseudonocardia sp.]|uniref:Uncharacterized protein n=1 Tax=uncultured Pseudonocardia sp. TaxID=211455 RepID=A0A6J4NML7_9PSEU|nr:MAG: hypothetical protein AVDCRST_MAG66-1094 [uncultured Pseudonocardia sp.]
MHPSFALGLRRDLARWGLMDSPRARWPRSISATSPAQSRAAH